MKEFYLGIQTAAGELIIHSQFHALHMLDAVAYVAHDDRMALAVGLPVKKIQIGEVVDQQGTIVIDSKVNDHGPSRAGEVANHLADLIWWLHGYRESHPDCHIQDWHLNALREARDEVLEKTS